MCSTVCDTQTLSHHGHNRKSLRDLIWHDLFWFNNVLPGFSSHVCVESDSKSFDHVSTQPQVSHTAHNIGTLVEKPSSFIRLPRINLPSNVFNYSMADVASHSTSFACVPAYVLTTCCALPSFLLTWPIPIAVKNMRACPFYHIAIHTRKSGDLTMRTSAGSETSCYESFIRWQIYQTRRQLCALKHVPIIITLASHLIAFSKVGFLHIIFYLASVFTEPSDFDVAKGAIFGTLQSAKPIA